jgi:hypothetical protein
VPTHPSTLTLGVAEALLAASTRCWSYFSTSPFGLQFLNFSPTMMESKASESKDGKEQVPIHVVVRSR